MTAETRLAAEPEAPGRALTAGGKAQYSCSVSDVPSLRNASTKTVGPRPTRH
jgi:hypothetical protein